MNRKTNKAKRFSGECRNHGACEWCRGSRLHAAEKQLAAHPLEHERPLTHPMFGDFECDDYVFDTRLAAVIDDHEFAGWWEHTNDRGALRVPLIDAARFR